MKTVDLTPKLRLIMARLQEDKKDPVHALRVACKRIRALLLFGKSYDELSCRIKDIKNSLTEFRNEDIWILILHKHPELKYLEDRFRTHKRRRIPSRKRTVKKAKGQLYKVVSNLSIRGKPDLAKSERRLKKSLKKYKRDTSPETAHALRKKATTLLTQLELNDEKPSKARRLRSLKNLLGQSRDIYSLREELKKQKLMVPEVLETGTKQERQKALKASKKILK